MTDVEISFMREDLRPAFVLANISGADFNRIKSTR